MLYFTYGGKFMNKFFYIIFTFVAVISIIYNGMFLAPNSHDSYSWVKKNKLIAHAMGGFTGTTYTNSRDAFIYNYDAGFKVFEVDLTLTSDNALVLKHDWSSYLSTMLEQNIPSNKLDKPLSLSEFKEMKIHNYMEPLTFDDLINLMKTHKDIYLVTDTKDTESKQIEKQFSLLIDSVNNYDPSILKRIIPQIYNEDMFYQINNLYHFDSYIFTLYQTNLSDDQIINFMNQNNLKVVTMHTSRMTDEFIEKLSDNGIYTFVHTINSIPEIESYQKKGVYGFYTDYISPNYYKIALVN